MSGASSMMRCWSSTSSAILPSTCMWPRCRALAMIRSAIFRVFGDSAARMSLLIDARVPDSQVPHLRILAHALAVAPDRRAGRFLAQDLVPTHEADGHDGAGGQAFEVPLPGSRQGLVEIVDPEHEVALGRREDAEIGHVHVAAGLDRQARHRACAPGRPPSPPPNPAGRQRDLRASGRTGWGPETAGASWPALREWPPGPPALVPAGSPRAARGAPSREGPFRRPCAPPPMAAGS